MTLVQFLLGVALMSQTQPAAIPWGDWGKVPLPDAYLNSHLVLEVLNPPDGGVLMVEDSGGMRVQVTCDTFAGNDRFLIVVMPPEGFGHEECDGETLSVRIAAHLLRDGVDQKLASATLKAIHQLYLPKAHLRREVQITEVLGCHPECDTCYRIVPILEADSVLPQGVKLSFVFRPVWDVTVESEHYSSRMTGWNDCGGMSQNRRVPCKPEPIRLDVLQRDRYFKFTLHPVLRYYAHPCGYIQLELPTTDNFIWFDWQTRQLVDRK